MANQQQQNTPEIEIQQASSLSTAQFYGPVKLISWQADGQGSYFWVDDPNKLPERAIAVRVPLSEQSLLQLLQHAFQSGTRVEVAPGHRWWLGQNQLAWTIYAAKLSV